MWAHCVPKSQSNLTDKIKPNFTYISRKAKNQQHNRIPSDLSGSQLERHIDKTCKYFKY